MPKRGGRAAKPAKAKRAKANAASKEKRAKTKSSVKAKGAKTKSSAQAKTQKPIRVQSDLAPRKLRIGLSACFFHADPKRPIFKGKTLLYLEQSLAHWIMEEGALVYMIPSPPTLTRITARDWAQDLDGLVLQGGSDVCPRSYNEKAQRPEWEGDYIRDQYEISLFNEFKKLGKPILGICRGAQLVNVACGGTLYQDIATEVKDNAGHRDWENYDNHFHPILFESDSKLARLYPGTTQGMVNTIHHQAIKNLGQELAVEARSEGDGLIEAVRGTGESFVYAVQWHPEFHDPKNGKLLDGKLLLNEFLKAAKRPAMGK